MVLRYLVLSCAAAPAAPLCKVRTLAKPTGLHRLLSTTSAVQPFNARKDL